LTSAVPMVLFLTESTWQSSAQMIRTVTKTVSIDAPVAKVFAFLADASTWPRWAIINVKAIAKADGEWWEMQTPGGSARLRIRA
jgi:uncharacterized protein YndB with AHSA1/START domain